MLTDKNDPRFIEAMARNATAAANALAEHTEWAPAGYMLRVVSLIRSDRGSVAAATSFALSAQAECLNPEGRRICDDVIGMLRNAHAQAA